MPNHISFLSFSGGLDSTTLLCKLLAEGDEVHPVFFNYGSKHNKYELDAAENVVAKVCPYQHLQVVDLSKTGIFSPASSALMADNGQEIPEGGYATPGSLAATVVPGRNLIMASILASMAEVASRETNIKGRVCLGVHAGDHNLYPDCRPAFLNYLETTIYTSTEGTVHLYTPFKFLKKSEIVNVGIALDAPYYLTRSCYKQQRFACGKCGTCLERLDAFAANNTTDPIPYA